MLCDYLLHRALFFGKSFYEQKVSAEARQAFLNMSRAAHTAPEHERISKIAGKITSGFAWITRCRLRTGCLQALQMVLP